MEFQKKLEDLSKEQREHHKRDLALRIFGIAVSSIIGIVGIIYNQEIIIEFFQNLNWF